MSAILSWVPRTVKIVTILVTGATGNIGRHRCRLPVRYEQCDRAEAVAAFQRSLARTRRGLDQLEDAVDHPQEANGPVAELTGSPAASVAQWAAQNAELFS